jgi:hypothetical protein
MTNNDCHAARASCNAPLSETIRWQRKAFFFEKKNQKTFARLHPTVATAQPNEQKFFASFFQKRSACLPMIY